MEDGQQVQMIRINLALVARQWVELICHSYVLVHLAGNTILNGH
jgi:hypothetical protein